MTSLAIADRTINVPFYGNSLFVVEHNGEPYTPMKPIIDGMGMDWASQFTKLKQRFKTSIVKITMQLPGDNQRRDLICLALRKLAGWLQTISPNKVRPEIRDSVIRYQEECDDVLYEYWTKGEVKNPRKKTTVDERTPLRDAVNMLVSKRHMMYPEAYAMIHQQFNVESIEDLEPSQVSVAIEYVHRIALEGEFLGKQEALPAPAEKQFTDSELYELVCLWSTSLILREEFDKVLPAMKLLGSSWGKDVSGYTQMLSGFINCAGLLLQRESSHISTMDNPPSNWVLELARMKRVLG